MKPQKQLFRHDPAHNVYGDCYRTAVACLLDLDAKDVPHFNADTGFETMQEQDAAMGAWLRERGLVLITIPMDTPVKVALDCAESWNPGIPFILTGWSRNDTNHCVVCCGGDIVCDPSLTDSGIVGPADNGFYWLTYIGKAP